jgi:hypothetical protein
MRGHGALLGAADATFRVSKQNGARLFEVDEVNDGPDDIQFAFTLESVVLSTDEETGKETTAPIVVPQDAPAQQRRSDTNLSPKQLNALDALTESLLAFGEDVPGSFGLPSGIQAVSLERWRQEVYARRVLDPDAGNPRQEWKRLRDALVARRAVGIRDDLAWRA